VFEQEDAKSKKVDTVDNPQHDVVNKAFNNCSTLKKSSAS
jgi:hypothetical protein